MSGKTPDLPDFEDLSESKKLLVMSLAMNDMQSKVAKHEQMLVTGNGTLPLAERIRNVEAFIGSVKYWLRLLVGAILIQTVSFAAAAVIYFVRLYPLLVKISNQP